MLLLIEPLPVTMDRLRQIAPHFDVRHVPDIGAAEAFLEHHEVDVVVLGPALSQDEALEISRKLHEQNPTLSLVLATVAVGTDLYRQAMRAGVSDVFAVDATPDEVRDVIERTASESQRLRSGEVQDHRPRLGTTLATFSTKGGCGKSFMATNLATLLAERYPGEVVLVDLDLQAGDVAIMLQLMPEYGFQEAAEREDDLDDEALEGLLTSAGPLKVLAAPDHPVHAEVVTPETVTRVLALLRTMYRWIVIDGPPSFTDEMLAAIEQIDTVLVVSSLDVPSIKNLKLSVDTLKELGVSRDRMQLVLNRADSKVGLTVREVEKSLGTRIDITIPSSREVPYAVNQGVPIVTARPKAAVSKALREALQHLLTDRASRAVSDADSPQVGRGTRARRKS